MTGDTKYLAWQECKVLAEFLLAHMSMDTRGRLMAESGPHA